MKYKDILDEMSRVAAYHGIVRKIPIEGEEAHFKSINGYGVNRYVNDTTHYDYILNIAKSLMKEPVFNDPYFDDEDVADHALNMAIYGTPIFQNRIDSYTYERLLNDLSGVGHGPAGYNDKQEVWNKTASVAEKQMNSDYVNGILGLLKSADRMAFSDPNVSARILKFIVDYNGSRMAAEEEAMSPEAAARISEIIQEALDGFKAAEEAAEEAKTSIKDMQKKKRLQQESLKLKKEREALQAILREYNPEDIFGEIDKIMMETEQGEGEEKTSSLINRAINIAIKDNEFMPKIAGSVASIVVTKISMAKLSK